ncbi:MAG: DMT family transporter [Coriobacteriales bacterium]|jgi:drug/metabolite transporter (DMT)-like permease|nr:DMT family transporter [Coriobacteriales bacterium]
MEHRSARFKQIASTGILLAAALVWGMCFVAQRSSMEHVGPFLFNGLRELLGAATLLVVLLVVRLLKRPPRPGPRQADQAAVGGRYLLFAGVICGVALYLASNFQQVGMVQVSASKAAFITTLYIILVPILGLLLRQRTHWNTWVSVGIAVVGLYLLCISDSLTLELGDGIVLASALFWAVHILAVGYFAPRLSLLQLFGLCVIQFAFAGVLSLMTAPFMDHLFVPAAITLEALGLVAPELLYAGILSTAGGFTLAAIGQRYAQPAPAAIVMSTESVFGLLGGVFLLGETLTAQEGTGCALMLVAIVLTQLSFGRGGGRRRRGKRGTGREEAMQGDGATVPRSSVGL